MKIPKYLYRGDGDRDGDRRIKQISHFGIYQTNLVNGGKGRLIFEEPLLELINRHVGTTLIHSHFLSFSEDLSTAYHYGLSDFNYLIPDPFIITTQYFEDDPGFDFGLLTLLRDMVSWNEIDPGVYEGYYPPTILEFARLNTDFRVLLLDILTILKTKAHKKFKAAISNAHQDKEWLLLPATIKQFNNGQVEYSGLLDGGCIDFKRVVKI